MAYRYKCGECGYDERITRDEIRRHYRVCSTFAVLLAKLRLK